LNLPKVGKVAVPQFRDKRCTVLAAVVAAVLLAWSPSSANAGASGRFCPPIHGSVIELAPYGTGTIDRCAHAYHNDYNVVFYYNDTESTMKCAVLKTNRDGTGGNVGGLAAACAPGRNGAYQYPVGLSGYATGINQGTLWHDGFWGYLAYGL
jgi:hypothetical protein